jgi:hypothetical protein
MNYIQQINAFWDKLENDQDLKPTAIVVYTALLQINNKTGWKDKFRVVYGQVLSMTGISKNTYYSALDELVKGDYLEYEKGPNQYQAAVFKLNVLYQNLVQQECSNSIAEVQQEYSIENIPKPKNTKPIKPKKEKCLAPTIFEVENFFVENNFPKEKGAEAWKYYEQGNWHDNYGKPVLNWKQKMRGVWFKNDNKQNIRVPAIKIGKAEMLYNQLERLKIDFDNE